MIKTAGMSEKKQQDLECATQALEKSNTDFIKKEFDKKVPFRVDLQRVP